jgi:RNA polymerase sigma factor (sigma-70 family)
MSVGKLEYVLKGIRRAAQGSGMGGLTDGQLLARYVAAQDEVAFEVLLQRHGQMVYGVCRRVLRHAHEADDAFQATFLVLVRKAASIRRPELLGNWLWGVARRTALEARTVRARRERAERSLAESSVGPTSGGHESADWLDYLDQEVERLPAKYRVPVIMCDLEGAPRRDAARQLGIPEGTLSSRLATARKLLARRLARYRAVATDAGLSAGLAPLAAHTVSPGLVKSTRELAALVAAGKIVTAPSVVLMTGVLKAMMFQKLKFAGGAALSLALVIGGAGALLSPTSAAPKNAVMGGSPVETTTFVASPRPDDRELILGTWEVVKLLRDGKAPEKEEVHKLVFTKDRVYPKKGDKWDKDPHTYKLDPTANPKQIDTIELTQPMNKVWKGVYELTKDELKICSSGVGKERPARLTEDAPGTDFMILRRSKTPEDPPPGAGKDPAHPDKSASASADVRADVRRLVAQHFPEANIVVSGDSFTARRQTMTFTLHPINRDGSISETTHQTEGPKHDGFLVTITTHKGRYAGPLAAPQTLREPYWNQYVNALYDEATDTHLWIVYAYGRRVPAAFHEGLLPLLGPSPAVR